LNLSIDSILLVAIDNVNESENESLSGVGSLAGLTSNMLIFSLVVDHLCDEQTRTILEL